MGRLRRRRVQWKRCPRFRYQRSTSGRMPRTAQCARTSSSLGPRFGRCRASTCTTQIAYCRGWLSTIHVQCVGTRCRRMTKTTTRAEHRGSRIVRQRRRARTLRRTRIRMLGAIRGGWREGAHQGVSHSGAHQQGSGASLGRRGAAAAGTQGRVRRRAVRRPAAHRQQQLLLRAGEASGGASHSICHGSGRRHLLLRRRLGQVRQVAGVTRVLGTDGMAGMSHTRNRINTHLHRVLLKFLDIKGNQARNSNVNRSPLLHLPRQGLERRQFLQESNSRSYNSTCDFMQVTLYRCSASDVF